jgi:putative colanic acid biosynthesis UDP-glucose lipid carrier transferase
MWQSSIDGLVVSSRRGSLDRLVRSLSSAEIERHCLQLLALTQATAVILTGGIAKITYLDIVLGRPQPHTWYLLPAIVLAIALHYFYKQMGLHRFDALMGPTIGFGRIWGGLVLSFMVLLGGLYLLKMAEDYSRGWFLSWFALSAVALVVVRWGFMKGLTSLVKSGRLTRHFAVLGTADYVNALKGELEKAVPHAVVTGVYLSDEGSAAAQGDLDTIRGLRTALQVNAFEKVIIALPVLDKARIRVVFRQLASYAPEILLCSDPHAVPVPVPVHGSKPIGTLRADVASPVPAAEQDRLEKRIFDCAVAMIGLVVLSPLFLIAALAIKLDSPGPVFFRQRRYGRNNRVFRIFKFRTMTVAEDGDQVTQAQRNDVRVTRVGRILRATSIDEIPQLLNVLVGHMSIVGPRPHALAHEEKFEENLDLFSRRRRVLPGITGWAQVNGQRGETKTPEDVEKRMDYDLYYIDNWSIWFDMEIIVRTAVTVLRGAY